VYFTQAASESTAMQMVKIRFPDEESRTQGFYELMKRVRVVALPEREYLLAESSLQILDDHGISYSIIDRCSLDHALKTLRDTAASPI